MTNEKSPAKRTDTRTTHPPEPLDIERGKEALGNLYSAEVRR